MGVFWGCLGGVLSVCEGFSAEIAILAVLGACGKAFWGRSGRPQCRKIDFCRICRWFVEGLRGVVGVFWGCFGGFLMAYEGFSAEIAILAVLGACGEASGVDLGGLSALEKSIFHRFADSGEPRRSPEGADSASRVAASLDDHPARFPVH